MIAFRHPFLYFAIILPRFHGRLYSYIMIFNVECYFEVLKQSCHSVVIGISSSSYHCHLCFVICISHFAILLPRSYDILRLNTVSSSARWDEVGQEKA